MRNKIFRLRLFCLSIIIFLCFPIFPAEKNSASKTERKINLEKIPEIPLLQSRNDVFKEYSEIVEENYKLIAQGKTPLLLFFKYKVPKDTTLIQLASRCNIPYETLATLNGVYTSGQKITGRTFVLPTVPGLFISSTSDDSIQTILREKYSENLQTENICYNIGAESFTFLQSERFSPTERAYFLDTNLGLPMNPQDFYISSSFGRRQNPFSGEWKDHKGVDFAAEEGKPVYAVKEGEVSVMVRNDKTFGNYIILSHDKGAMTSVYAHLSRLNVAYGDKVKRGDIIGYVGKTGLATGSHLHFEIRHGGVAEDPEKALNLKKSIKLGDE